MGRWCMGKGAWPCLLLVVPSSDSTSAWLDYFLLRATMPAAFVFVGAVGDAAHGRFCWPRKALSPRRFLVDSASLPNPKLAGHPRGGASTSRPLYFPGGISSAPSLPHSAPPGSQMG